MITTGVLDNFNRANGAPGASWASVTDLAIVSNAIEASAGFGFMAWASDFTGDHEAFFTIGGLSAGAITGPLVGFDAGALNGYVVQYQHAVPQVQIVRLDGGSGTVLKTISVASLSNGTKIGARINGTNIEAFLDTGSGWTLIGFAVDPTYRNAEVGFMIEADANSVDDFGGGLIANAYTAVGDTVGSAAARILEPDTPNGRGIVWHHGWQQDETTLEATSNITFAAMLAAAGYTQICVDIDPLFGNDTALTRTAAAHNYLASEYSITQVVHIGISMGGISGKLLFVGDTLTGYVGYVGFQDICDLAAIYADDPDGAAAVIDAAYPSGFSGHDPLNDYAGTDYAGLKMRFYASAADISVPKADHATPMAALVSGYALENTVVETGGDHGDPTGINAADVLAFVNRCFAPIPPRYMPFRRVA